MQDADVISIPQFEEVAKKSVKGLFALISRTFFIQIVSVVASFVLTVYLTPEAFGVFFVVSAVVVFLNYFQDIGLAASLIQKKEEPTAIELRSTFTIQQILVLGVVIPVAIFAPSIADFYKLDQTGLVLLYALLFSFLASSLKTIPTVLLERSLNFHKLVIPQIVENLAYNICLIVFAVAGFGVHSFTIAVLARSILGLIVIYWIQKWPVGIALHKESLKKLLSFGVPFQANSLLALVKDDLFGLYIAKILPLAQVGYVGFGQKWAFLPMRLFMDNIIKITFPSFSRLQHDKDGLRKAIEKTLFLISVCIFPTTVAIIFFSNPLVAFIPNYQKWEPAITILMFFAASTILSSLSTPLTNILNAIGKVKITLYFMIMWTVLTWTITPLFIYLFGYNGVGYASLVISFSSVIVFIVTRRYVYFSFIKPILPAVVASIGMGIFTYITLGIVTSFPLLILEMTFSMLFYFGMLYVLARSEIHKTVRFVRLSIRKEK